MSLINNRAIMDEETLIDNCIKGNYQAQKKLFEKFAPKMMFVCLRYCKDKDDAEDILQDSFIKVFNHLKEFNRGSIFEAWVRRIVVNTCLDFLRKKKSDMFNVNIDDAKNVFSNNESVFDKLNTESLLQLIHTMPNGYKLVFNLFAIEGYSHKEIASMLSISEETSKSQFFRARAYLKKKLELLDSIK